MSTRIFQPGFLQVGEERRLTESAHHHLVRVLRAKVGSNVTLFNGEGGEYSASLIHLDKKTAKVKIDSFSPRETESPLELWLAQGISRGEKMDYVIQKATELGVKTIIPLFTERCNVQLEGERKQKRWAHWQSIAISACEQCGRNRIPDVKEPISLGSWLKESSVENGFVLSPHEGKRLQNISIHPNTPVILLIGPEGGLSEEEMQMINQANFTPLHLGPRILRTETAAVSAITALQCYFGDM
jgi:16S rRNA (uracil1498-N3)-methyltransferase